MSNILTPEEALVAAQKLTIRVDAAFAKRQDANTLFIAGDLQGALRGYHFVLFELKGIPSNQKSYLPTATEEEKLEHERVKNELIKIKKELSLCYLNMAAISIKTSKFQKALDYATQALALDETNVKSSFRKGQALIGLGQITSGQTLLQDLQKRVTETTGKSDAAIASVLYELKQSEQSNFGISTPGFKNLFKNNGGGDSKEKVVVEVEKEFQGAKIEEIIEDSEEKLVETIEKVEITETAETAEVKEEVKEVEEIKDVDDERVEDK